MGRTEGRSYTRTRLVSTLGVAIKQPKGLAQCAPPAECLWADFGGAAHHLSFSADRESFESNRVGDGETVLGARVH